MQFSEAELSLLGEVEVVRELDDESVVIGVVRAGEFVGEMGVIEGRDRSATVRASGDLSIELIDKDDFDKSRFHCKFCALDATETDPLSIPVTNGIVWYGTWEDAMAEKERTGKPVMLHFGSPRCQNVPGVW